MYITDTCACCGEFTNVKLEFINKDDEATFVCDDCIDVYNVDVDENMPQAKKKNFTWQEV